MTAAETVAVTLRDALADARRRLQAAGVPDAAREAARILGDLTGREPAAVWADSAASLDPPVWRRCAAAIDRRAAGVPTSYVTGLAGFRTLTLEVDPRVLIPRPETEGLVELALAWTADREGLTAADLGTGSGCIALALAVEGRFDCIVAVDVSEEALEVARRNAQRIGPPIDVEWRRGSLTEALRDDAFDLVVSNPPYLTEAEHDALDSSVRVHEPRGALVSGPDGMDHLRELFQTTGSRLRPGGLLALEIDARRVRETLALAIEHGWTDATVREDVFGRPRFLCATKGAR